MQAETLLRSAVALHRMKVEPLRVPDSFETIEQAREVMRNVLLCEGHADFAEPLATKPEDPFLHCIDLAGARPGIVETTRPKIRNIFLNTAEVGDLDWNLRDDAPIEAPPVIAEDFEQAANRILQGTMKRVHASERKAATQERADMKTLERREERKRKKEAISNETPEEKKARLQEAKEKREARKREKEAAHEEEEATEVVDETVADEVEASHESVGPTSTSRDDECSTETKTVVDTEKALVPSKSDVLPAKLCVTDTSKFYANPTPATRHISALSKMGVHASLTDALLRGQESSSLEIVFGPPGTGKSKTIVDRVAMWLENTTHRIFVCAPSNVSAAGIYLKLMQQLLYHRDAIALCLPPSRTPPDVPVHSNDCKARVVVATVSGRNGPRLVDEEFDVIALDEAAQCTEAATWTLLRPAVCALLLVGDTNQLPAIVSTPGAQKHCHDRSLMARLVEQHQYPITMLATQYRMHPDIAAFPNNTFYEGRIGNAESTTGHVLTDKTGATIAPLSCVRVPDGASERLGTSWRNAVEAERVAQHARTLRKTVHESRSIVVITGYQAHARCIMALRPNVDVHTVDSFQGREADVVIVSICRTGGESGFWSDARRLNVALTRAQCACIIVGSFDWTNGCLKTLRDCTPKDGV